MAKRDLPQIYFDEHIKPDVIEAFKDEGFKCLLIAKTRKYAGKDEKDYIMEIYAEGKLFATSDVAFISYVLEQNIKHAGIVGIPPDSDKTTRNDVSVLAEIIKAYISGGGKNILRKSIIYVARDGYRLIDPQGKGTLLLSWDALAIDNDILEY